MKKIIILFLIVIVSFCSNAQMIIPSTLNAAGGTVSKGYYNFEWSIGESTAVSTLSNVNSMLTQGILQYHSGNVVERNLTLVWHPNEVRLFPNPVKNFLEIDFKHLIPGTIHLEFLNKSGQVLWQKELDYNGVSRIEKLNMSGIPAGEYALYISQERVQESYSLRRYYKRGAFSVIKVQ